jgi:myo-inositol-1-phosphate synthase
MENNYFYKYLEFENGNFNVKEKNIKVQVKNYDKDKKLGIMIVGIGGNNGSTLTASLLAYNKGLTWENKNGEHSVKWLGSISQYGSINLGYNKDDGKVISKLMKNMVSLRNPEDIVISGWDICEDDLYKACKKNKVIDPSLINQLKEELQNIIPIKSIFYHGFIATNQNINCNNAKTSGNKLNDLNSIKYDIEKFKDENNVEKVIVIWAGSTEKMIDIEYESQEILFESIVNNSSLISPSMIFAIATILSGNIFMNTSPQNTINKAILKLAEEHNTYVGGSDLKSGQTKLKSVLVDFLASSSIKPLSIVSYNHLGNNDGLNLSEPLQFQSKEITKRNVIDDVIDENPQLFEGKKPDHEVIIKYVPAVGDSKRAIDEYYSELMLDGKNIMSIYNLCEDSLLAVPLLLDISIFSEFFSRITFILEDGTEKKFSSNLSLLSFFFKSPIDDDKQPIINSFFKQRNAISNFIKVCCGLPIDDFLNLHTRF